MTPDDYLRVIFGLLVVIGLIGMCALIARKAGFATLPNGVSRRRRLSIVETLPLDARRRLIIVKHDDREHLIVLGAQSETLVDSQTAPAAPQASQPTPRNPFAELRQVLSSGQDKAA